MSEIEKKGFTFVWKIENYSFAKEGGMECINSPNFCVETLDSTKWHLRLYPRGNMRHNGNTIACGLVKCNSKPYSILVDSELSFLKADGTSSESLIGKRLWFHEGHTVGQCIYLIFDEVVGESRNEYLPGDILTVQCRLWFTDRNCCESGIALARTRIGVERKSFVWPILDFSTLVLENERYFIVESTSEQFPSLYLKLFLTSDEKIQLLVESYKNNYVKFSVSVLDFQGRDAFSSNDEFLFVPKIGKQIWKLPFFLKKDQLTAAEGTLLQNDILSLKCDFAISLGIKYNQIEWVNYRANATMQDLIKLIGMDGQNYPAYMSNSLKEDIQNLYEEKSLCDVIIRVGDQTFKAHKAVLGARSPVFKAMFENVMTENLTNFIEIEDCEPEIAHRMLLYMYTDNVGGDVHWEMAFQLYMVADKYDIHVLKEKCSLFLKNSLCISNACDVLFLSDILLDKDLKTAVREFIYDHENQILESDDWRILEQKNSRLTSEIWDNMSRMTKL